MTKQLFTNNATGVLTVAVNTSMTTLTLDNAAKFPTPTNGDYFFVTLIGNNANGQESSWEIVKCTAKSGNNLTVERGAEGTTAVTWAVNTKVELRLSAGFANEVASHLDNTNNPHNITKAQLGLGNVDNTSDLNKPVSTAQAAINSSIQSTAASDATTKANAAKDAAIAASAPLAHVGATGNAHGVATTSIAGFMSSGDKAKLDGVAVGATAYAHPANHPASIITQDANNRFVTDAEKTTWNGAAADATSKANAAQAAAIAASTPIAHVGTGNDAHALVTTTVAGFMSPADKTKLDGLQGGEGPGAYAPISHVGATGSSAHGLATPTQDGFMSIADKIKLDGLPNGNNAIAIASKTVFGGVIVGDGLYVDTTGRISVSYDNVTPRNQVAVINDIGTPGQQGFGVGICPALPTGYTAMIGTNDITHDNYGNYTFGESTVVYVPAFYYKIGTGANGLVTNRIDIKPIHHFENLSIANTNGYTLPLCFYNGNAFFRGIFVDKYLCSKSPNRQEHISVKNGKWQGQLLNWGAITTPRIVSSVTHNVPFLSWQQQAALTILIIAHGQAATSSVHCGWFTPTYNFPKIPVYLGTGALGSLSSQNQTGAETIYISDGTGVPLTGSADIFERTTHNGQKSGITDLINLGEGIHPGHFVSASPTEFRSNTNSTSAPAAAVDQWDYYSTKFNYPVPFMPSSINTEVPDSSPFFTAVRTANYTTNNTTRYLTNNTSTQIFHSGTDPTTTAGSAFFFNHLLLDPSAMQAAAVNHPIYGLNGTRARLTLTTHLAVRPSGSSTTYSVIPQIAAVTRRAVLPNSTVVSIPSGLFNIGYANVSNAMYSFANGRYEANNIGSIFSFRCSRAVN